jgi:hypothetical protein
LGEEGLAPEAFPPRLALGFALGVKGFGGVFSSRFRTSSLVGLLDMMLSNSRKPSLNNATARVARASEHVKSLENGSLVRPRSGGNPFHEGEFTPTPLASILIGEIAYNLKAALDYLVFELFYLETGEFNNDTKFIIEHSPEAWNSHFPQAFTLPKAEKKLWLHKLRIEHQAALKGLQPFSGIAWTKTLQKITNPDRHRELIAVAGESTVFKIEHLSPGRAATVGLTGFPAEMFVHYEVSNSISLKDGERAVETMHHLATEVGKVIEAFKPDFEREVAGTGHDTDTTDGPQ